MPRSSLAMKKTLLPFAACALVALTLAPLALAQAPGTGTGQSSTSRTAPTAAGTAGVTDRQIGDTAVLFRQLDADNDGKLTREEFARIAVIMQSAGTGKTEATGTGTTGTGAGTGSGQR